MAEHDWDQHILWRQCRTCGQKSFVAMRRFPRIGEPELYWSRALPCWGWLRRLKNKLRRVASSAVTAQEGDR